jgi:hypothetical protein
MKISLGVFAVLMIIGSIFPPAHTQSSPPGSLSHKLHRDTSGDRTLTAVCRIADGREQRTGPPRCARSVDPVRVGSRLHGR